MAGDRTALVDYDAVAGAYAERLDTELRGFRTGPEFLALWVHDEDDVTSIAGMVEAAAASGIDTLSVKIGPTTWARIDALRLASAIGALGLGEAEVHEGRAGTLVRIVVRGGGARAGIRPASPARISSPRGPRPNEEAVAVPLARMHAAHREAALAAARSATHRRQPEVRDGEILISATDGPVRLDVVMDRSTHCVTAVGWDGTDSPEEQGVLETVAAVMEGAPLVECSDHAAIRAEHRLRDPRVPRPSAGIVLAERMGPELARAQRLVRAVFAETCRRTGATDRENFHVPAAGPDWRALDDDQRLERVRAALPALLVELGLSPDTFEIRAVRRVSRVCLSFLTPLSSSTRSRALMDLELALQRSVDPTLTVEIEPRPDANRLRRL